MKIPLVTISLILVIIIVTFFVLGKMSATGHAPGLIDNKLAKCGSKPNCVCSEYTNDRAHYISPVSIDDATDAALMIELTTIIRDMGGEVDVRSKDYIAARFTSPIFGFVDDLEVRIDQVNHCIQLRSASRVGYSDGGVNQRRVSQLKKAIKAAVTKQQ